MLVIVSGEQNKGGWFRLAFFLPELLAIVAAANPLKTLTDY